MSYGILFVGLSVTNAGNCGLQTRFLGGYSLVAEISAGEFGQGSGRPAIPAWRQRRGLLLASLAAILALLLLLYYGLRNNPNVEIGGAVPLNRPAPNFAVATLDGQRLQLRELRGQVVVVNVWASWCVPCRQEAAELNRAYARYSDRGVAFVGIAWNDEEEEARAFVRQHGVPYATALDPEGRIAIEYGITGVPETFLIDREGRLVQKWVGPVAERRLGALLEPLLR